MVSIITPWTSSARQIASRPDGRYPRVKGQRRSG
jgi:hypothetical protein